LSLDRKAEILKNKAFPTVSYYPLEIVGKA